MSAHATCGTVSLFALRDEVKGTPTDFLLRTLAGAVTTIKFFSAQVWLERNRLWHCQVLIHLNLICKSVLQPGSYEEISFP